MTQPLSEEPFTERELFLMESAIRYPDEVVEGHDACAADGLRLIATIRGLEAENARLRYALEKIAAASPHRDGATAGLGSRTWRH